VHYTPKAQIQTWLLFYAMRFAQTNPVPTSTHTQVPLAVTAGVICFLKYARDIINKYNKMVLHFFTRPTLRSKHSYFPILCVLLKRIRIKHQLAPKWSCQWLPGSFVSLNTCAIVLIYVPNLGYNLLHIQSSNPNIGTFLSYAFCSNESDPNINLHPNGLVSGFRGPLFP
jgi:hypothetical protein